MTELSTDPIHAGGQRPLGARRPLAVRVGISLFLAGFAITSALILLPHPPEADTRGYLAMALLQLLFAIMLLLKRRGPADRWLPALVVPAGIVMVTAAVYFNGESAGGPALLSEFFYVWPALYAGYFFPRRGLAAAVALTAMAYAAVLAGTSLEGSSAVTRWLIVVGCVAGIAVAARALRIHVDRLVERLRAAVRTDPLTGVLNRRGFQEDFEREIARAGRSGQPLSVLVGDVDRFKALNDRFGHGAGDRALAAIGAGLQDGVRTVDTVARIGGEEFAMLLPATDSVGGFDAAERLRAAVSAIDDPAGRPLTISFGVATCSGAHVPTADRLLAAADAAMYEAKARGRDRTIAAADLVAPLSVASA